MLSLDQRHTHAGLSNLIEHHGRPGIAGANHRIGLERQQAFGRELAHITDLGRFLRGFGEQAGGVRAHQQILSVQQIDHFGQRATQRDQAACR